MRMNEVPFNVPAPVGNELRYIAEACASPKISGDGAFGRRAQALLGGLLGGATVLLTTSCTHALEMSGLLLDLQPGDEVIMPSFTFVSTANAYVLRGARPVFVDVDPRTLNIDPAAVRRALTPRTRAIVAVNYAGIAADLDALGAIAAEAEIDLIEDNAHGLFGRLDGRPLGTFGRFATLSFHETKNVFCGEGGALVLNDPRDVERAEIIREKGTNRARFFRGMVDKYSWVDVGSSYVQSEILAAFLTAQLEAWERVQATRRELWEAYHAALEPLERAGVLRRPVVPPGVDQAYHLYYVLLPSAGERDAFIAALRERNVYSYFHYLPLHRSEYAQAVGAGGADCPVTDDAAERLARLPLFGTLGAAQAQVIDAVHAYAGKNLDVVHSG
jgi:dTDP-4-amino-4,6-dideoxygalactose transaminase